MRIIFDIKSISGKRFIKISKFGKNFWMIFSNVFLLGTIRPEIIKLSSINKPPWSFADA